MGNPYIQNTSLLHELLTNCGASQLYSLLDELNPVCDTFSDTGIFYIARQFMGIGAAIVTASGIRSTNASWNAQHKRAQMNEPAFPYPDPYAAAWAARQAMAAGTITKAVLMVQEGHSWTVGSDNPLLNGGIDGNAAQSLVADIGMSSAVASDVQAGSLLQHQLYVVFNAYSGFTYINKTYPVRLVFHHDAASGTLPFTSGVLGKGFFKQLYGEFHGFRAELVRIDNPNAIFSFTCTTITIQQWLAFGLSNFKQVTIAIDTIYATDAAVFMISTTAQPADGSIPVLTITVKNVVWGKGQVTGIGQESDDWWYFIYIWTVYYGMQLSIHINNMDMVTQSGSAGVLLYLNTYSYSSVTPPPHYRIVGMQFDLQIDNLYEQLRPGATVVAKLITLIANSVSLTEPVVLFTSSNNAIHVTFQNANVVSQIGYGYGPLFYGLNNYLTFNLGNFYRRVGFAASKALIAVGSYGVLEGAMMMTTVTGNIILEDGSLYAGLNDRFNNTLIDQATVEIRNGNTVPVVVGDDEQVAITESMIIAPADAPYLVTSNTVGKKVLLHQVVSNKSAGPNLVVSGGVEVII
jgi:hypothetical protein